MKMGGKNCTVRPWSFETPLYITIRYLLPTSNDYYRLFIDNKWIHRSSSVVGDG
jgi:hypothetical protein